MEQKAEGIEGARVFALGWKVRLLILGALLVGLGAFVYASTLRELALSVLHREGSSVGLFVPLISGWFLWRDRERIRKAELGGCLLSGISAIAAGFVLLFLSREDTDLALPSISFLTVSCGLVLLILGKGVFRVVRFPLLFLAVMIPLPETMYEPIAEWVQATSTTGSVWLMQAISVPLYRDGHDIHLPNAFLVVGMGCSGIRYLLSYVVFSLPYAYLFKRGITARALTVLAAVLISLVAGVLRLSSIYLAVYLIGPFWAEHRPHVALSWSVFVVVMVMAIAVDRGVARMNRKRRETVVRSGARCKA